jgi:hypothetical protein
MLGGTMSVEFLHGKLSERVGWMEIDHTKKTNAERIMLWTGEGGETNANRSLYTAERVSPCKYRDGDEVVLEEEGDCLVVVVEVLVSSSDQEEVSRWRRTANQQLNGAVEEEAEETNLNIAVCVAHVCYPLGCVEKGEKNWKVAEHKIIKENGEKERKLANKQELTRYG